MFVSGHDALFAALAVVLRRALGAVGRAPARARAPSSTSTRSRDGADARSAQGRRDVRSRIARRDELAQLGRRRRRAWSARLDGEERARRELLAAVSHDLRTPITSLRLLAEAIDDDIVDDDDAPRVRAPAWAPTCARSAP